MNPQGQPYYGAPPQPQWAGQQPQYPGQPGVFMPSMPVAPSMNPNDPSAGLAGGLPGIFPPAAGGPVFSGAPGVMNPSVQVAEVLAQSAMQTYGQKFFQGSSEMLQRQMGWFSNATFYHLFNVTNGYVLKKLRILAFPFLAGGPKTRQRESISHATFKAPRHDVNSPDLYIPTMALFTWVLLVCLGHVINDSFTTDLMYSKLWRGAIVWLIQTVVIRVVLGLGGSHVQAVPNLELAAYAGYTYFYACLVSLSRTLMGPTGSTGALLYSWICLASFLRETLKRVIVDEMRVGATDPRQRYMLFAVMLAQGFWLYILS